MLEKHEAAFPDDLPAYLTVKEVATLLRIGKSLAYDLVSRGHIKALRLGRVVRVPLASFMEWVQSNQR